MRLIKTNYVANDFAKVFCEGIPNELSTVTKDGGNLISQVTDLEARSITWASPIGKRPTWTPNVYNNKAMAFFNGNSGSAIEYYLSAGNVNPWSASGQTIFIFGKHANTDSQMYISKHNGGTTGSFFLGHTTSTNMEYTTINATPTRVDLITSPFPNDTFQIITAKADFINNKAGLYRNGTLVNEMAQTGPFNPTSVNLMLGSYQAFATFSLTGYIGHWLIFSEPLSATSIQWVCEYIRKYWNYWDA
jgi:hypothetical protein